MDVVALRERTRDTLRDVRRVAVAVATSDRFLQGALTGTLLGIITSLAQAVGQTIHFVLYTQTRLYISAHLFNAIFEVGLLVVIIWADRHQEEWRDLLAEASGEDPKQVEQDAEDALESKGERDSNERDEDP